MELVTGSKPSWKNLLYRTIRMLIPIYLTLPNINPLLDQWGGRHKHIQIGPPLCCHHLSPYKLTVVRSNMLTSQVSY